MELLSHPCLGESELTKGKVLTFPRISIIESYENGLISLEEIMADLVSVVNYLHDQGYAHLSINLDNVYYVEDAFSGAAKTAPNGRAVLGRTVFQSITYFDDSLNIHGFVKGPNFGYRHPEYVSTEWNPVDVEYYAIAKVLYELTVPLDKRGENKWFVSFRTGINPIDYFIQTATQLRPGLLLSGEIIRDMPVARSWTGTPIDKTFDIINAQFPTIKPNLREFNRVVEKISDKIDEDTLAFILNNRSIVANISHPITFYNKTNYNNPDLMTFLVKFNPKKYELQPRMNPFLIDVPFKDDKLDYFPPPSLNLYPERRFKVYATEPSIGVPEVILDYINMPIYKDGIPYRSIRQILAFERYNYPEGYEYSRIILQADSDFKAEALSDKIALNEPLNSESPLTISELVEKFRDIQPNPKFNIDREFIFLTLAYFNKHRDVFGEWIRETENRRLVVLTKYEDESWSNILMRVREMLDDQNVKWYYEERVKLEEEPDRIVDCMEDICP